MSLLQAEKDSGQRTVGAAATLAIAAVGVLSMSLCLAALRGRTRHG
jgi:hypothetical protein